MVSKKEMQPVQKKANQDYGCGAGARCRRVTARCGDIRGTRHLRSAPSCAISLPTVRRLPVCAFARKGAMVG